MRHVNYVLKPATIDNAKPKDKRYDLTDGGGLVLEVMPSGSKTWRFKYHLNGKREKVTIGAYPAFTIKQARDRHEELRALVERGQSPAKAKRVQSTEQKAADARRLSFRTFAQRWVDETLFYRSGGYVAQTVRWLDVYVYPAIGDMQLDEVQPGDVLAIIKARADTAVTAERIRVIVQQIYNHAIRNLLVTTNPAQPLRGAIARAPVEHHRHLSEKELGAFWRKLDEQGAHTTTIAATKLLLLTMTGAIVDHIATVYKENSPESIYFLMLYNIFNEFLGDVNEDVLPNDRTGYQDTLIWQKLFNFQRDAATGIINKLETYSGCILADSVGLGKTFTALATAVKPCRGM